MGADLIDLHVLFVVLDLLAKQFGYLICANLCHILYLSNLCRNKT